MHRTLFGTWPPCSACSIHTYMLSGLHHCPVSHTGTTAGARWTCQCWLLRLRFIAVPAPFTKSRSQAHTIAALLYTQAQLPVQGALFSSGFCVSDLLRCLLHSHDHALKLTPLLHCFTHRHNCRCREHSSVLAFASQIYCSPCSIHTITHSSSHQYCAALHTGTTAGAGGTLQCLAYASQLLQCLPKARLAEECEGQGHGQHQLPSASLQWFLDHLLLPNTQHTDVLVR